ncbi:hypothetical protein, partial [Mesorhizobium sp.]|uniref:hypothetical protein n=1 Tax=Mesorhizobium sp. TaxID=1871066 RepID=UPI0025F4B75F
MPPAFGVLFRILTSFGSGGAAWTPSPLEQGLVVSAARQAADLTGCLPLAIDKPSLLLHLMP